MALNKALKIIKKYRHSLSGKLIFSVLVVSSLASVFTTAFQVGYDYQDEVNGIEENLSLIKKSHVDGLSSSLWNYDLDHLKTQLQGVLSLPGIRYIEVSDTADRLIMAQGEKVNARTISAKYLLTHTTPDAESNLGAIVIVASLEEVHQRMYHKIFVIFFTQFLKTIVVSTLVYFTINQILIRHLLSISKYVKSLNFKDQTPALSLQRRTNEETEDELDVLVTSLNHMQDSLFKSYQEVQDFNEQLAQKVQANTEVIIEQRGHLEHSAKMSALGEMAGGMAHEINTPLAIIQLRTDQLSDQINETPIDVQAMDKALKNIDATIKRIAKIINGLRSFARDGRNEAIIPYSISRIVEDTFSLCSEHLASAGVSLKFICEKDVQVKCRPIEISQVLLNLLNNARDAIQDCPEKWITVEVVVVDDHAEVCVTDSGSGIPEEVQQKMMQPFFTTKEIGKGTGLGLSISKGIIQAHGGQITINNLSPNTQFVVSLPL